MIMDMQKLCIIVIVSFLMLFSHISKQMYNNVQHSQNKYFADDVDFYAVYSTVYRSIATLPR